MPFFMCNISCFIYTSFSIGSLHVLLPPEYIFVHICGRLQRTSSSNIHFKITVTSKQHVTSSKSHQERHPVTWTESEFSHESMFSINLRNLHHASRVRMDSSCIWVITPYVFLHSFSPFLHETRSRASE